MVVLAVTWMAKTGQEAEVAGVLSKLTEGIAERARLRDVPGTSP
jgi:hypothetical protein